MRKHMSKNTSSLCEHTMVCQTCCGLFDVQLVAHSIKDYDLVSNFGLLIDYAFFHYESSLRDSDLEHGFSFLRGFNIVHNVCLNHVFLLNPTTLSFATSYS